jgi:V/A-type H+-transporting ATPase subunit C
MNADQYIYVSAKIRSLEKDLLSEADITRVVEAKTPDVAFKAFNSLDYAGELLNLEAKDYRTAMARKMARLKKVLERTLPDQDLLRLLFLERDFQNIRLFFNERISGLDHTEHLETTPGLIPVDQLRRYIVEDLSADIDPTYKEVIDELKRAVGDRAETEFVSNAVDRRLNRLNNLLAERLGNPFIITLYRLLADKSNLKLFLRGKRLGMKRPWLEERLSRYGSIGREVFLEHFEANDETEFIGKVGNMFPRSLSEYLDGYLKDKEIWRIELGLNNLIVEHLRQAKLIAYGPEVVVAYFFAQKYAIKNLSTIMALKFGGIEPEEIRRHLVTRY